MWNHSFRDEKDTSGCAISGIMSETGKRFSSDLIMRSIANMRERSNGLGGGFAAYGIYPHNPDDYALHIMFDQPSAQEVTWQYLKSNCEIIGEEPIPTRPSEAIKSRPLLHRYFVKAGALLKERYYEENEDDLIVRIVMHINRFIDGAFVLSSGKNMGIFKGVGYPEDVGRFFRLEEHKAYLWLAHGRFPTNTTGWWGGAHPFGLLDWAVVHNGEISSYGINRRYLENFSYFCALRTDTEVITYLFDLLMRKHNLPLEITAGILAPPFWSQIQRKGHDEKKLITALRMVYGGALLNGPFSVLVGNSKGMIGLNDRTKLRPMIAARKNDMIYIASEESAIRTVCPSPDNLWHAEGGIPIVGQLKEQANANA